LALKPICSLKFLAFSMAAAEKFMPVAFAPNLAQERVSKPKWRCKCSNFLSFTSSYLS
jgi:hypothetical protein